jgi:hypothetical protein
MAQTNQLALCWRHTERRQETGEETCENVTMLTGAKLQDLICMR